MTTNEVKPIIKPRNPIHAEARWINGFPNIVAILAPNFARKARAVKSRKKTMEKPREMAMKAGVVAVGDVKKYDVFPGRKERSYVGFNTGSVQARGKSFFDLAQEPKTPKSTVGPSTLPDCAWVNSKDGLTDNKET